MKEKLSPVAIIEFFFFVAQWIIKILCVLSTGMIIISIGGTDQIVGRKVS